MPNLNQSNPVPVQNLDKNLQKINDQQVASRKLNRMNVDNESGRMHIAFDQDVEIPDLFNCNGR